MIARREAVSLIFLVGLVVLLAAVLRDIPFGGSPMEVGQAVVTRAPVEVGTANIVTSVVLAYRGLDTLGELTILFVAATGVGLVLGHRRRGVPRDPPRDPGAGFVLRTASDLLFPFLIVLGAYIVVHGHLTPGGGFQGGAILAAAFFVPLLARPESPFSSRTAELVEGFAGASFIVIGLLGLLHSGKFLSLLLGTGTVGNLFSAGSLPLLYLAVGLKVGAELAGLMAHLFDTEAADMGAADGGAGT